MVFFSSLPRNPIFYPNVAGAGRGRHLKWHDCVFLFNTEKHNKKLKAYYPYPGSPVDVP